MSTQIDDLDFNTLRSKIIEIIGNGSGTVGYGQSIQSSSVLEGNLITKSQWDGLRNDLINIFVHQTGVTPSIVEISKGDVIRRGAGDPLQQYDVQAGIARNQRFVLAPSQSVVTAVSTKTFTSAWSSAASLTATATFGSADQARYFFNSGGQIRISSSRTGGSNTSQNNAWTNILAVVGQVSLRGNTTDQVNFYNLTDNFVDLISRNLSTPYSSNTFRIQVRCNVPNNSSGTANIVYFQVLWTDPYVDPFAGVSPPPSDSVDGTLSLVIDEVKAAGVLKPNDTPWVISSPTYVVSNITAT